MNTEAIIDEDDLKTEAWKAVALQEDITGFNTESAWVKGYIYARKNMQIKELRKRITDNEAPTPLDKVATEDLKETALREVNKARLDAITELHERLYEMKLALLKFSEEVNSETEDGKYWFEKNDLEEFIVKVLDSDFKGMPKESITERWHRLNADKDEGNVPF